ncbi:hypothetical protein F8B43_4225 [Methylorubrum populi]|uniref:Uncharacterized protein n=1 Tax=Methylorubrum populi TaxID=223967 RepID=A0A833J3E9_9HYPH|nr:hypothetical protein F8B43_4225 [Methylorubrum populi]
MPGASNPEGLSPFDLSAQLYRACMRLLGAEGPETRPKD